MRTISLDAGKDFEVVTVSFDPRDTPALASPKKPTTSRSTEGRPGAAGWHFLTGGPGKTYSGWQKRLDFKYAFDEKANQFIHASAIMVLTPDGSSPGISMVSSIRRGICVSALIEASQRRIGNPVDQILLFCFHYDPATGRYGLLITRVMRITGTFSVLP